MQLSTNDIRLLAGVHPDLVKVVARAAQLTDVPFKLTEGLRTVARQKELVKKGASKTMNSRHLTGHAVDIVPMVDINKDGRVTTDEMYAWPSYYKLAAIMKRAAKECGVAIEWGGDWKSFKDGPHWQLPWKQYPNSTRSLAAARLIGQQDPAEMQAAVNDTPYTNETETTVNTKALASAAGGVGTSVSVGLEPVKEVIDTVVAQQFEFSSGSLIRIGIAVVILGATIYYAWRTLNPKEG